jgi:hypothetical protein
MIYTPEEYAKLYPFGGTFLSARSIKRRCRMGRLPKGHIAHRKSGGWIIEVLQFSGMAKGFNIVLTPKKETV